VDETQQPKASATEPEEAPTSTDALKAFFAAGGTFGMAVRDGLAQAQLSASGAAQMSGDHIANLLYGSQNVDEHTAPYTGRAYPNPNDYRDRDTNATSRHRR
jgi:hypothetical protein